MRDPYLIKFPKLGQPEIEYISVSDHTAHIPFAVQRVFWTYCTPDSVVRGRHTHHQTEQILIAVAGRIVVTTELADGNKEDFCLEDSNIELYLPSHAWHTMQYSHSAIQLVLASTPYDKDDYILEYNNFKWVWQDKLNNK